MTRYLNMLAAAYDNRAVFGNLLCSQVVTCGITRRFYFDIQNVESFVTFGKGA